MPLWILGAFFVVKDLFGFLGGSAAGIAHEVHLAGAALGFVYRFVDLRLSTLTAWFDRFKLRRRAQRRWRNAPPIEPRSTEGVPRFLEDLENQRLDRILEKISRFGKESLTDEEVEFLDRMSDRYRGRG